MGELHRIRSYGALGDHRKALEYMQKALAIRREVLPERHHDTANSLINVGSAFHELGDHRKALEYTQQGLSICREVLGERHPDTARCLDNVGGLLSNLGDPHKALAYAQQALSIRCEVLGEAHPDTLASRKNVARCLIFFQKKIAALQMIDAGLKHAPADREFQQLRASLLGRPAPKKKR